MEKIKSIAARVKAAAKARWTKIKAFFRSASPKAAVKSVARKVAAGAKAIYHWFMALPAYEKVFVSLALFSLGWHLGMFGLLATLWVFAHGILTATVFIAALVLIGMVVKMYRNFRASGAPAAEAPAAPATVSTPETRRAYRAKKQMVKESVALAA